MRLFWYYALHSFKNQLKKLFKTWVLVFLVVCMLIGGLIGFGAGKLSDMAEENDPSAMEEILPPEPEEEEEDIPTEIFGLGGAEAAELIAGVVVLAILVFETMSADKSGGRIFLPADVPLLFASPMRPQSVLMFRLMSQLGAMVFASVYLLFQLPNLIFNLGLSPAAALAVVAAWMLTLLTGRLVQVMVYLLVSGRPEARARLRRTVYLVLGAVAAGYIFFWRSRGGTPIRAAADFFNAPVTRFIPVWGWLKGILGFAAKGDLAGAAICLALSLVTVPALIWIIRHTHADFYEDAMAKTEEVAELLEQAQSEKSSGLFVFRRKKDRADRLRRDAMRHGAGASVFFFKSLYNRFRFAHLGVFTKTTETYLAAALGVAAICRFVAGTDSFAPVGLTLSGLAFFRALGNPLAQDTRMDSFRLIPENTWAKLFYSLLGGAANCLMDMLPAALAGALLLGAEPLSALAWLPFAVSVDLYATTVGAFIDLSVPVSAGKTIKQVVQILFLYFGLLPDIAAIAIGGVLGHLNLGVAAAAAVNGILGMVFFGVTPLFLEPPIRPVFPERPFTGDLRAARRSFSRMGLICALALVLGAGLQAGVLALLRRTAPELMEKTWVLLLAAFLPMQGVALPLSALALRRLPGAQPPETHRISPGRWLSLVPICLFLMYAGNLVSIALLLLISPDSIPGAGNPVLQFTTGEALSLQVLFFVILAPLLEEWIFRKLLLDRMRPYGERRAAVTTAILFGLYHGNLSQCIYAFLLGLLLAFVYLKTGRLRYTIALHLTVNTLGGVVAPALLRLAGLDGTGTESASLYPTAGQVVFLAYVAALLIAVLFGVVMLCIRRRELVFPPAEQELPRGGRFSTVWVNPGMILLVLLCLGLIVYTTFAASAVL